MDSNIDIKSYVNQNTIKYGIGELSELSSLKIQEQLVLIENYLQEFCEQQKKLAEQIKQYSKLSIFSISSGANVPRSQINLNINTLKLYIERRIQEITKEDTLKINSHEKLKTEKKELDLYIDGLRQEIVDVLELKQYIDSLEGENKRLIKQLDHRQKDIQKLEIENSKLRKNLNEHNNKKILKIER